uniref:Vacuole membrane protein 1 n=1 Tax=Phallusia mammillata TaxID=59560 RepID=A0A6F9DVY3_9ASCI|nr:vacuole membrane protein 1 [Phallusia mammillata]
MTRMDGSVRSSYDSVMHEMKLKDREERSRLVIWRQPFRTLYYFIIELSIKIRQLIIRLMRRKTSALVLALCLFAIILYYNEGPHTEYLRKWNKVIAWCAYWVGLGILSSVGLGTGLHTFLLYLGPHIAGVTLAAFECMSVDFPEPPYPDQIVCPEQMEDTMTIWTIISKVRLEAFMWGAGTALGELPPYFMARAATLSGIDPDDEDYEEAAQMFEADSPDDDSISTRVKIGMKKLVQKVGFFGILLCASIPNPLFDLAGITCGHFLVPFWTFFGATLIGKAVIKMHIQKLFIVMTFSKHHVEMLVDWLGYIPALGRHLQAPFKEFLQKQKANFHHKVGTQLPASESWLAWFFEKLIIVMVLYFVISIVNSMAQTYMARKQKAIRDLKMQK